MKKVTLLLLLMGMNGIALAGVQEYFPGPYGSSSGSSVVKIEMKEDPAKGKYYAIKLKYRSSVTYILGFPGTGHPGTMGEIPFNASLSILLTSYTTGKPVTFYGGPGDPTISGAVIPIHRVSLVDASRD